MQSAGPGAPERRLQKAVDWLHFRAARGNARIPFECGTQRCRRPIPALAEDRIRLVLYRPLRRQPYGAVDARRRHAPCVDAFILYAAARVAPCGLATPLIARLAQRYPKPGAQSLFTALMHFTVCAGISVLNSVWAACLRILWNPWAVSPPPRSFPHLVLSYFNSCILSSLILYTAILALRYLLDSSRRLAMQRIETAQLSEQLIRAQLTALQRQIEPHFLFNALNSIAGLVREARNDAAVQMIAGLSDFLREVIQDSNKQQVSLAEEMEFVQKYLQIQKVRFADRLQLSVIFPRNCFRRRFPGSFCSPLSRTRLNMAFAKRAEGGLIRIAASQASDMLQLSVYNDGPKLADSQSITHGVGMASLRARLQNLYGASFDLSMCNAGPCGVEVLIRMPFTPA